MEYKKDIMRLKQELFFLSFGFKSELIYFRKKEPEIERNKNYLENLLRIDLDNLEGELEHISDMFDVKMSEMNEYVDKYIKQTFSPLIFCNAKR